MTLHTFIQYIIYKWKAKGRHGTHSPFVYAFIEDGLQKIKASSLRVLLETYFNGRTVIFFDGKAAERHLDAVDNNVIMAVKNVHTTRADTEQWNRLTKDPRVRLSIDLYEYGLLFFDEAFKEKQHFVVKYPA